MKSFKSIILGLTSFSMIHPAAAQVSQVEPSAKTPAEVVGIYFQSLSVGDFALLGRVLDDQIVWHQPGSGNLSGTYKGKEAVFALFGKFMQISQGSFKIDRVHAIMANGNLVTASVHFSAQKAESSIAMDGIDLMKVENGKITEVFLFSSDQKAEDDFWI